MTRPWSPRRIRHWETFGLVLAVLLVIVNIVALSSGALKGPWAHPVVLLVGAVAAFLLITFLGGASRDSSELWDADSVYGDELYKHH